MELDLAGGQFVRSIYDWTGVRFRGANLFPDLVRIIYSEKG